MPQSSSETNQLSATLAQNVSEEQLHFADVPLPPKETIPSLQELRELKNMSIDEVAITLRLSLAQINALESRNWTALPGTAYIKGFLRNYSRLLGVAPEDYIKEYDASLQASNTAELSAQNQISTPKKVSFSPSLVLPPPTTLSSLSNSDHEQESKRSLYVLVAFLILSTTVFLLYWERSLWLPKFNTATESINTWFEQFSSNTPPPVVPVTVAPIPNASATTTLVTSPPDTTSTIPSASAPNSSLETSTASNDRPSTVISPTPSVQSALTTDAKSIPNITQPAVGPLKAISFQIEKPVWIEVRDSGNNILYYGTKTASTKETIKGAAPLSVIIGAADALKMNVDGKSFDLKSVAIGNVARFKLQ
jgi:cytoskeleton protein RodZ